MLLGQSNIGVTAWAAVSFRAVATFDDPSPVFAVTPLPDRTRGAVFVGFELAVPGVALLVTYRLDVPLLEAERIYQPSVHAISLDPVPPFNPIPFTLMSADPSLLLIPVLIEAGDPPQFSPPAELQYQCVLGRADPV